MAKGKNSSNSLKALAYPIQRFIASWGQDQRTQLTHHSANTFPPLLELYALRGEGILRERFFHQFMEKLPVALTPIQQVETWQTLVEDGGHIQAWVERLGLVKALKRESAIGDHAAQETRKLFCILLEALKLEHSELLAWAVEGYFFHVWKSQFPEQKWGKSAAKSKPETDLRILKATLISKLGQKFNEKVVLKESFTQTDEVVNFKILYRFSSLYQWHECLQLERPRLKQARLAAYQEGCKLENLESLRP